jgi:hypothetical protein
MNRSQAIEALEGYGYDETAVPLVERARLEGFVNFTDQNLDMLTLNFSRITNTYYVERV